MSQDNSDPAFPIQASEYGGHGSCFGMTLRDYFAAQALAGMTTDGWQANERQGMAVEAYRLADAMLNARSM
jgi:ribonuclease I